MQDTPSPVRLAARGFAPVENADASVLILGSMPGTASLKADQYYAHPRNAFWPIMCALLKLDPQAPYAARTGALKAAGIALWDVLHSCIRDGSLDAAIDPDSEIVNDFSGFLLTHPKIHRIYFNGSKAEASFQRHAVAGLGAGTPTLLRLPSTSPANATYHFEQKLTAWRVILDSTPHTERTGKTDWPPRPNLKENFCDV